MVISTLARLSDFSNPCALGKNLHSIFSPLGRGGGGVVEEGARRGQGRPWSQPLPNKKEAQIPFLESVPVFLSNPSLVLKKKKKNPSAIVKNRYLIQAEIQLTTVIKILIPREGRPHKKSPYENATSTRLTPCWKRNKIR